MTTDTSQGLRHYSSCGKSHGKERPKRKALRRPRKTDIGPTAEGAECGRDMLGQTVPSTGSSDREGPIANGGQPYTTTDIQRQWGSRSKASPGPEISRVLELIGEIRCCCPVQTFVHENSKLELNRYVDMYKFPISSLQCFADVVNCDVWNRKFTCENIKW